MRVLAVDPGKVRVGLALSDEGGRLATPHSTLAAGARLAARIADVAQEAGAGSVIVGLPRRLDGSEGPEAEAARALADEIAAASGLAVELWDERFTTDLAQQTPSASSLDARAAAHLLSGYLAWSSGAPA